MWLILEPILLTSMVMVTWSLLYGGTKHGVRVVPFVLTGYSMLTLWRQIVTTSISCFRRSADVIYHRQISPIDVFISKQLTEIFGALTSFFVAYCLLLILELTDPVDDYLILVVAWFLMAYFSLGLGMIVAALTEMSETAEHFIAPIMYVMLPITGVFFMVGWLPRPVRDLASFVPNVNAMEMFRAGYFGPGVPTYWDAGYLAVWGLALNVVGTTLLLRALARLEV